MRQFENSCHNSIHPYVNVYNVSNVLFLGVFIKKMCFQLTFFGFRLLRPTASSVPVLLVGAVILGATIGVNAALTPPFMAKGWASWRGAGNKDKSAWHVSSVHLLQQ